MEHKFEIGDKIIYDGISKKTRLVAVIIDKDTTTESRYEVEILESNVEFFKEKEIVWVILNSFKPYDPMEELFKAMDKASE